MFVHLINRIKQNYLSTRYSLSGVKNAAMMPKILYMFHLNKLEVYIYGSGRYYIIGDFRKIDLAFAIAKYSIIIRMNELIINKNNDLICIIK
jgi:hypothetical protein